jgi:hypothetical protein
MHTYYVVAKIVSASHINREKAIPFFTRCMEKISSDTQVEYLEMGETV